MSGTFTYKKYDVSYKYHKDRIIIYDFHPRNLEPQVIRVPGHASLKSPVGTRTTNNSATIAILATGAVVCALAIMASTLHSKTCNSTI